MATEADIAAAGFTSNAECARVLNDLQQAHARELSDKWQELERLKAMVIERDEQLEACHVGFVAWFQTLDMKQRIDVWYECEASTAAEVRQQLTDTNTELEAAERVSTEQRERAERAEAELAEAGAVLGAVCVAATLRPNESLVTPVEHAALDAVCSVLTDRDNWFSQHNDEETWRRHAEAELEKEKSWCAKVLDGYRQLAEYFQECANNMTVHESTSRRLLEDARDMAQASFDEFSTQCPAPTESAAVGENCGNCARCLGTVLSAQRMVVCPTCGNKRCPKATYHGHLCSGSNEAGQPGSDYHKVTSAPDLADNGHWYGVAYDLLHSLDNWQPMNRRDVLAVAKALEGAESAKVAEGGVEQLRSALAGANIWAETEQAQVVALTAQLRDLTAEREAFDQWLSSSHDKRGDSIYVHAIQSKLRDLRSQPSPTSKQDSVAPSDSGTQSELGDKRVTNDVATVVENTWHLSPSPPDRKPVGDGAGATSATGEAKPAEPKEKLCAHGTITARLFCAEHMQPADPAPSSPPRDLRADLIAALRSIQNRTAGANTVTFEIGFLMGKLADELAKVSK